MMTTKVLAVVRSVWSAKPCTRELGLQQKQALYIFFVVMRLFLASLPGAADCECAIDTSWTC